MTFQSYIPGTSIQNARPDCQPVQKQDRKHLVSTKEWKKCPADEKARFQSRLMKYLRFVVQQETRGQAQASLNDEVATWHFRQMDGNNDNVSDFEKENGRKS